MSVGLVVVAWLAFAASPEAASSTVAATSTTSTPALRFPSFDSPAEGDEGVAELEDVVVTGTRNLSSRAQTPVVVEVIGREEIEESGSENLAEVLENAPGIQIIQQFGRAGIQIQGLDPQYTLVLVDGQRATGRVNGTLDLNRFPTERIERVEVVKGASSALYGADALGGVVNIITRRSKKPFEAELHASYGSGQRFDGSGTIGSSGEDYNVRGTFGLHHGASFQIASPDRIPGDPSTSGPGFIEGNVDLRAEYDVTEGHRLILRGDYLYRNADSRAATPVANRDGSYLFQTFEQTNRSENYSAALTSDHALGVGTDEPGRLQMTLYFNGWREQFLQDRRGILGDTPTLVNEQLGQLTVQHEQRMSGTHLVTLGTELLLERLEANDRICRGRDGGTCGEGGRGPTADDAVRFRGSVFLQDEWTVLAQPRLVIVPGFRADVDTQFGTNPTPKISARFDPLDALTLRASVGLGFRPPSFRELYLSFTNPSANYYVTGNPELDPETSRSWSAGVEIRPFTFLDLSANVFRNDLTNLIDFAVVRDPMFGQVGLFQYVNIAEARTQGLETQVNLRPFSALSLSGGYSFLDARNETEDTALLGRAKHRIDWKLRFEEAFTDCVLFLNGQWVGPRAYPGQGATPEEDLSAPAYVMFDARLSKRFGERLDVFVGLENLFDASDAQFLLVRPRTVYTGVTGRL